MTHERFQMIILSLAAILLAAGCSSVDSDVSEATALAYRIADGTKGIVFEKMAAKADVFSLRSEGGKVIIGGNNANSMAVGLNYYLKHYCQVSIGWMDAEKAVLPQPLPQVDEPVQIAARVSNRFFLNYCTFGYTMPWWQWSDWEHFIDWMALNGVNLPLAITGQEAVWQEVWSEMGLSDEEIRSYFTGPAHLPWHRMINIDSWGGPLPQSWLDGQAALQKKIVARERALNMRPVLPAFSGHVPAALKQLYPEADVQQIQPWAGFAPEHTPSVLDPMDSLFPVIQRKFLEKQTQMYGTDHVYGIDLFNEIEPKRWDPDFLAKAGAQTYGSLSAVDPEATWLQMTWLFWYQAKDWTPERIRAYITSYPADRSLLLDYFCESAEIWRRTEQYYGVPYIWCYLGNFGGNTVLTGNLAEVGNRIEKTFEEGGAHFKGIGCTLEALDCNPYLFEFVLAKAWEDESHRDLHAWTGMLSDSRTGKVDERARKAWKILVEDVYSKTVPTGFSCGVVARPSLTLSTKWLHPRYEAQKLEEALALLREADGKGLAYRFDLANLERQVLANRSADLIDRYQEAYAAGDAEGVKAVGEEMLALIDRMEEAVEGEPYFSLDKWISDARAWGTTPQEKDYFEQEARNILTTWGDYGSGLTDYAARTDAGLLRSYYKVRWKMFFDRLNACMASGEEFDEAAFDKQLKDFEFAWWHVDKQS